ncbi:MAG: Hsp20/alpha crystallin family protein [Candidatus Eisenbacteria bacterium]|uniref:Hsp20/alpha crystallin family protein n=1 Tax=Eiseniibacteriota bacterium TaxID=2212470 RepID=A0A948RVV8_UNCEI|nr:Hsp20/alpha crystallin family protein [Candidatus Eisenbacteria bacterium]MBU1949379.1 Hsp20/alpha crystallin family protein [Candidatus Eisenbacteria bacterium]MBU2690452.1 Hsp20/alpha crystallin family protein [Candidatus Eisenbacteria bacterium]
MTLVRWQPKTHAVMDPFFGFNDLSRELNRLFEGDSTSGCSACNWAPAMDVIEKDDNYIVTMDLPGLSKEEVELTLHNNHLNIKGERKIEHDEKIENVYRSERIRGMFERTIKLPTAVNTENVEATFTNGVLEIRLPKTEEAKARQIAIKG